MNEREHILAQVAGKKLPIDEALALLAAIDQAEDGEDAPSPAPPPGGASVAAGRPRFLRVIVKAKETGGAPESKDGVDIDLCLPLAIARAFGPSLAKMIPQSAQERMRHHGFDFARLDLGAALDELDDMKGSSIVDVAIDGGDGERVQVNIYVE